MSYFNLTEAPQTKGNGPGDTGMALSNAQRQARYRDRQFDELVHLRACRLDQLETRYYGDGPELDETEMDELRRLVNLRDAQLCQEGPRERAIP